MNPLLYLESRKDKNSKLLYNLRNVGSYCVPNCFYRNRLESKLSLLKNYNASDISTRLNYYNKLEEPYRCKKSKILRYLKSLSPILVIGIVINMLGILILKTNFLLPLATLLMYPNFLKL